ncbi:MAG TPA: polyamine aminopropyltransferase [Gammaproteobacteria bacterium]|jgi:spermidine synthase|nr:polyamine aminopropyltransferase [Gammaproteobacteria bacterium]
MKLDGDWFSEIAPEEGMALSLAGARRLHAEQTAWQTIEIYETETFGTLMVIDGCVMVTDRDSFIYHEMLVHPVLFAHPSPRRVLIFGGGDCGTLREVLRHKGVESVVQAELDERVTRLAELYFPELCEANADGRAELWFGDGVQRIADARDESLDVIIIDSTDPVGPSEGSFSEQFYRDCRRILRPEGLLVQQTESPFLYADTICDTHQALRAAGFADSRTLTFPQPTFPSGWWSATLAKKDGRLNSFRRRDAEEKLFSTHYYSAAIHETAFVLPPFLRDALATIR